MKIRITLGHKNKIETLAIDFQAESHGMAKKFTALLARFNLMNRRIDLDQSYWNFHLNPEYIYEFVRLLQCHMDSLSGREPEIQFPYKIDESIDQSLLNIIHDSFEKYLSLVLANKIQPVDRGQTNLDLTQVNLLIHKIENFHRLQRDVRSGRPKENITCTFGYRFENDEFQRLQPEDFEHFVTDFSFGDMFCGYNTTGKSFAHCMHDNDIELVSKKGVRPQRTYSTEGFFWFGPRVRSEVEMGRIKSWWDRENISQYGYRFDDKENAYGLIRVAKMIEPSEFQGKSHWEKLLILDRYNLINSAELLP